MTQRQGQDKLLSIHEFAQICRDTPRTLRFYEQKGLFKAYFVDPVTKYRYYHPEQAREFLKLKLLQNFHMSLREIRESTKKPAGLLGSVDHQMQFLRKQIEDREKEYNFLTDIKAFLFEIEEAGTLLHKEEFGPFLLFSHYISDIDYDNVNIYRKQLLQTARDLGITNIAQADMVFYQDWEYMPKHTKAELALICEDESVQQKVRKLPTGHQFRYFPKTSALVYDYKGPYDYFILIYQKLNDYVEQTGLKKHLVSKVFDYYVYGLEGPKSPYDIHSKLSYPFDGKKIDRLYNKFILCNKTTIS